MEEQSESPEPGGGARVEDAKRAGNVEVMRFGGNVTVSVQDEVGSASEPSQQRRAVAERVGKRKPENVR